MGTKIKKERLMWGSKILINVALHLQLSYVPVFIFVSIMLKSRAPAIFFEQLRLQGAKKKELLTIG